MRHALRRISGPAVLIAGIVSGAWSVFGPPRHWHGIETLGRTAIGVASLTMISTAPRLIFPDTPEAGPDAPEAGRDAPEAGPGSEGGPGSGDEDAGGKDAADA
ncbi:hypothetical protein [Streptomyces sp. NPDC006193]|uniref:hypothetical protein n=1 Tax=Streptomyces sp. NPDC006193 TaxID=3155717 RepID=UPI0033BC3460